MLHSDVIDFAAELVANVVDALCGRKPVFREMRHNIERNFVRTQFCLNAILFKRNFVRTIIVWTAILFEQLLSKRNFVRTQFERLLFDWSRTFWRFICTNVQTIQRSVVESQVAAKSRNYRHNLTYLCALTYHLCNAYGGLSSGYPIA
jgi:hypothetical protein